MKRKNSPPKKPVITPTGTSSGFIIVRASVSARIRKEPPVIKFIVNALLCTGPKRDLVICGITSPTKPMMPPKLTHIPAIIQQINSAYLFSFSMLIPMEIAFSSPILMTSYTLPDRIRIRERILMVMMPAYNIPYEKYEISPISRSIVD